MEKIIIGSFVFDSDVIQSELAKSKSELDNVKAAWNEANSASKKYSKEILKLAKEQARLRNSGEELSDTYQDNANKLEQLKNKQELNNNALIKLEKNKKELNQEYRDGIKVLQAHLRVQDVNIENYQTEGKSIKQLRRESSALSTLRNELKLAVGEEAAEVKQLNAIIEQNTMAQKANVNENQKRYYQIGQYKEALSGALGDINNSVQNLQQGNFTGFATSVRSGFAGMTQSARVFFATLMSNPITAVVAVLALLAAATVAVGREFWNYNEAIRENIVLTEQITRLQGEAADKARIQAQAYTDSFGGEFRENLQTAKSLVEDFGGTYDEAFENMRDAQARGVDVNKQFNETIREYGGLMADAGYNAREFIAMMERAGDADVYNDKFIDAIKEANISLKEQTPATRAALENAFTKPFTDTLLKNIDQGKITVKEGLNEIAKEAERVALSKSQLATLTADVFRGAGEDAGGAAKMFEILKDSVENVNRKYTALEQKTYDLADAQEDFRTAKDKALKSDNVLAFQQEWDLAWLQMKTAFYEVIDAVGEGFNSMNRWGTKWGGFIRGQFLQIPETASKAFGLVLNAFKELLDDMKNGGKAINALFDGDFDGAEAYYDKFIGGFKNFGSSIKNAVSTARQEIINAGQEESIASLEKFDSRLQALADARRQEIEREKEKANKNIETSAAVSTTKTGSKEVDHQAKEAARYNKQLRSALEERAEIAAKIAQQELESYIIANEEKLSSAKRLTDALVEEEKRRLEAIREKEKEVNRIEQDAAQKKLQYEIAAIENKKVLSDADLIELQNLKDQQLIVEQEYLNREIEQKRAFDARLEEIDQAKRVQDREEEKLNRAIKFEEDLLLMQEQNASMFEVQREQEKQQKEISLEDYKQQLEDKLITKQQYEDQIKNLELQSAQTLVEISAQEKQARLQQASSLFGGVSELLGKQTAAGKAAGIAQATINTYQGVTEVWKAPSIYPEPFATIAKIANTAVVLGSGLKAVSQIKNTKVKGYAFGGLIDANAGPKISRDNGDDVLITAKTGEAILNEQQQRFIGYDRLALAGVPGFATGGRVQPSQIPSVQQSIMNESLISLAPLIRQAVIEGSIEGTYRGSQRGLKDLSTEREAAKLASHG